jgi:hypothetical protein
MYRIHKTLSWAAAACVLATAMACSNGTNTPASPSAAIGGEGDAAADGSTLKATAPTPMSPVNDVRLDSRKPTMRVSNSQGKYVGGTFTYEFQLTNDAGAVIATAQMNGGNGTTTWAYDTDLDRDTPYRWRARARKGNAFGPWSSPSRFLTVKENRTPNSPTGKLPLPNGLSILNQVVAQNPGITSLKRSCQEEQFGGDHVTGWEYMDRVIDALRLTDTRWGYNGKRGNVADPSRDAIAYNWGNQPDEGTTQVYIVDIMLAHCGGGSSPGWSDVTQVTLDSGTIGRWTSRGRFPGSQGDQ